MKILITAGPTREPIDAVRFISNYSSGQMGVALASAVRAEGHTSTLLLASSVHDFEVPSLVNAGTTVERFDSVADLKEQLDTHWPSHDVLIMAAAVADYQPQRLKDGKLHRGQQDLTIRLEPTPDLVAMTAAQKRPNQIVIAFALEESEQLESRAADKMHRKGVDAIVANPLTTLGGASITPLWMTRNGRRVEPGRMTKAAFAKWLLQEIVMLAAG